MQKKCPHITNKKKKNLFLASSTKSISVATQNYSDLWNLSPFCWQHFPPKGLESSISPWGIWLTSPVAACLSTSHVLCFELMEKQRCFTQGKGPAAWGLDTAHSPTTSSFPNPCQITSQRGVCKACSALQKEKPTFPDFSSLFTAKHNILAKALQPSSVYPRLPRGQRNCETLRDAKSPPIIQPPWKCKCIHHTSAATPALFTSPTWEQYFIAVQFKSGVAFINFKASDSHRSRCYSAALQGQKSGPWRGLFSNLLGGCWSSADSRALYGHVKSTCCSQERHLST